MAQPLSLLSRFSAAAFTAGMTLAVVMDPPETGAGGRSESPSSARILPGGRPNTSAATWVIVVYVPVPMSCVALATLTEPSDSMRTLAAPGERYAGYVAVA